MKEGIKNILKQDLKKYETLVKHTEGEAQEIYLKVANFLRKMIREQEVQMTREDLRDYRNNKDYIKEKMEELLERRNRIK